MYSGNIVIISPHMDDSIISLGGFIGINKKLITIIDVFSFDTWIRNDIPQVSNKIKNIETRKKEERENQEDYCYKLEFWDFQAAYSGRGYVGWQSKINWKTDKLLFDLIKKRTLENINASDCKTIIFPLAIGGHVDHIICNSIGLDIEKTLNYRIKVLFFEDLPYAMTPESWERSPLWEEIRGGKLVPNRIDVSDEVSRKKRAMSVYRSQFDLEKVNGMSNFNKKRSLKKEVQLFKERYIKQIYPYEERLWEIKRKLT